MDKRFQQQGDSRSGANRVKPKREGSHKSKAPINGSGLNKRLLVTQNGTFRKCRNSISKLEGKNAGGNHSSTPLHELKRTDTKPSKETTCNPDLEKIINPVFPADDDDISETTDGHSASGGYAYSKTDMSRLCQDMNEIHIPMYKRKLDFVKEKRKDNIVQSSLTKEDIKSRANEMRKEIYILETKFLQEVEEVQTKNEMYFCNIQTELESAVGDMESEVAKYGTAIENDDGEDKAKLIKTMQSVLGAADSMPPLLDIESLSFSIPPECKSVTDIFGSVSLASEHNSEIVDAIRFRDVKIINSYKHSKHAVTAICPVNMSSAFVRIAGAQEISQLDMPSAYIRTTGDINQFHSTGKIVKTAKYSPKINAIDVDTDGTIYVSCPDEQLVRRSRFDGPLEPFVKTYPLKCRGICAVKSGNILVSLADAFTYKVTTSSKRLVKKYSKIGKLIKSIEFDDRRRLFQNPQKLCENSRGDIAVVDQIGDYKGRIVVVNRTGTLKYTYSGPTQTQNGSYFDPDDVCFCHSINLLVADQSSQSIYLLNENGDFINCLYTDSSVITTLREDSFDGNKIWIGTQDGHVKILQLA